MPAIASLRLSAGVNLSEPRVRHNFGLSPFLHATTDAIAAVIVAVQNANWNFIIDQGATEIFAGDRTSTTSQLLSSQGSTQGININSLS